MLRTLIATLVAATLSGCAVTTGPSPVPQTTGQSAQVGRSEPIDFAAVVRRVEPVAEEVCREQRGPENCDYRILVDTRRSSPANAFQTLDRDDRPVIVFTVALLRDMRNNDEVAFVLGHEAAHHIEDHIPRTQTNVVSGAVLAGILAAAAGGDQVAIEQAQEIGARAGRLSFSKSFELEADRLGTVITDRAGYDPLVGAQFFTRIPDPSAPIFSTHPPNAERIDTVRRTVAGLD